MELSPEGLTEFFTAVNPLLDERQRRLMAGAMAKALGRGGPTRVAEASGLSRNTVIGGVQEVAVGAGPSDRVYGVYDIGADEGWMSVGDDHDTAAFAVNAVRRWWQVMGAERYPKATSLMITADAGGSNSYRNRAWKVELGRLAAETAGLRRRAGQLRPRGQALRGHGGGVSTAPGEPQGVGGGCGALRHRTVVADAVGHQPRGLEITVCHYPPGTSKWNKIEHRLFSFVTKNWRGKPLTSYRTIVELVGATKTKTGLKVLAEWDQGSYPTGVTVTDAELAAVPVVPHEWHGEWNYSIVAKSGKRPARSSN